MTIGLTALNSADERRQDWLLKGTSLRPAQILERLVAYFIVVASLIPLGSSQYLRLSLIALVPLTPVVLSKWFLGHREVKLTILAVLSIISGAILVTINVGASRSWDSWAAASASAQALVLILAAAGLTWACTILGSKKVVIWWCLSAAAMAPLNGVRFFDNPWKFGLALPVSVLLICWAGKLSSRAITLVFIILMGVSAVLSFRSWLLVLGMGLIIHIFRSTKTRARGPRDKARKLGLVAVLIAGSLIGGNLMAELAVKGHLGEYAQTRTQQSIDVTGNPFLGSRAEWGGALALMQKEPFGLGVGVGPSGSDWSTAISSLALSEGLKEQSNVADSFRHGRIEFHSMLWNYWSYFGLAGMALAVLAFAYIFRAALSLHGPSLPSGVGPPTAALAVLFVGSMWDILFSPSNSWTLALVLVLSLGVLKQDVSLGEPGEVPPPERCQ